MRHPVVYQNKIIASNVHRSGRTGSMYQKEELLAARSLMGSEMASSSYYFDFLAKKETMQKMESSLYRCFLYLKKLTFFFWKKWLRSNSRHTFKTLPNYNLGMAKKVYITYVVCIWGNSIIIVYNKVKLDYFCIIKLLVCRALILWYMNNESHGRKALLEKDTE